MSQKRSTASLLPSEENKLILDSITEGYWDWNIQEDYEYMSPRFWEILGYDPKDKKHHPSEWQKLIHPDYLETALEKFNKHIETKGKHPFKQEVKYKHGNGEWVWILCEGRVIEWNGNEPVRMVGTHKDIHEEKIREEVDQLIQKIQANYILQQNSHNEFFTYLLEKVLDYTESEYAFIGEVLKKEDGTPYLKTFALTDISWNNETAKFYRENADIGIEFFNLDSLFGKVITSEKELITNDAKNHPNATGIPDGHPVLNSFMGVPFFFQGEMVGMIGLANRPLGYHQNYFNSLKRLFNVIGQVIGNFRLNKKVELINSKKTQDLERILSSTPSCLKILKRDGSLVQMNDQGIELIEAESMDQVRGACVFDLVVSEHREEWIDFHNRVCDGETESRRFEIQALKGTRRWMETYAAPYEMDNGEIAHIAITNDITEKIKQEKELEEKSKRIELQFETSPDLIAVLGTDGYFKQLNKAWEETLGYTIEELKSRVFTDFVHPEDVMATDGQAEEIFQGDQCLDFTNRYITKEGKARTINWNARVSPDAQSLFAIGRDVTEELKARENRNFILETMRVGTWDWDIKNNELQWDIANYKVFGIKSEDFPGAVEAWETTIHPDHKDEVVAHLMQTLESAEDSYSATFPILVKDSIRHIGAKAFISRDEDGNAVGMFGINWDKSEEVQKERELEEQKKISYHNSKLASLGELAAGVGHEINNPMAIVSGHREMILRQIQSESPDFKAIERSLGKIKNATDRVSAIVQGLKTFSRMDENEYKTVELKNVVDDTLSMIYDIHSKEGIKFEVHIEEGIYLSGVKGRLQQILINLINNSKDALKGVSHKLIEIQAIKSEKNCTLSIKDNGTGIPEELQHKVFDPFFTSKGVNEGTGIGLSLCHQIVKEHNGEIFFSSEDGKGTTFYLNFPLVEDGHKEEVIENEKKVTQSINSNLSGKVILAEDEEDIRDLVKMFLELYGLEVYEAENGKIALEKFHELKGQVDIVMTDMKMPEMDGIELIQSISNDNKYGTNPKLVIMTGGINQNFEDKNSFIGKLISGYICKPFEQDQLNELLNRLLENKMQKAS